MLSVVITTSFFFKITTTLQGMGNWRDLDKYWTNGDTT